MVPCGRAAYSAPMSFEILLVEDNATFANSVSRFVNLIKGVHLAGHAKDGDEALEQAIELTPDLILMDIAMPKLTGLQVAQRLQTLRHPSKIIFLSMHADAAYREAAHKAGGLHFVTKANFVAELLPLIEQLVIDHAAHP